MATIVVMPQLGNSVESCIIVEWMIAEGDSVAVDQTLASIETDKSTMEVPSTAEGTVLKLLWEEGDEVPVKDPLIIVGEPGEDISGLVPGGDGAPAEADAPAEQAAAPEQAAAHPTWSMGQMNTLNSATLVNKGLELIEASLLFDVPAERIDVTVHPQSIVHSMVTFTDGATIAQASPPSMKLPIALALHWPYRVPGAQPALDFSAATTTNWEFMPVDNEAFPAVQLARQVATYGGMLPAVYNAANDQAAAQFLAGRIAFPQIVDTVSEILSHAEAFARTPESIMEVLECEKEARSLADRYLATIMR